MRIIRIFRLLLRMEVRQLIYITGRVILPDKCRRIASTRWEMYNYSNARVVRADYLKCTNLGLTYSFDAARWGISLLEVSASVSNPFIWTSSKLKGQTPVQSGFTEVQLSERPTFTFGLNVTF